MQVPVWLPESVHHARQTDSISIRYQLQATYAPIEYSTYSKEFYVFNPARIGPKANMSYTLTSTVGGFYGYGASNSVTKV